MKRATYKEKTTRENGFLQEYMVLDNGDKGKTDAQFINDIETFMEGNWKQDNHV